MTDADGEVSLERVTALARRAAEAPVGAGTHAQGRERLLRTAARFEPATARGRGVWLLAAALAALLGIALFVFTRPVTPPLSYEVRGNASSARNYVSARDDAPADVRFSDGSDVVARAGTRLRIEETKPNGARVLVERGRTTASIQHTGHSSWAFVAGPFEVRVTGTKLTIAWDPETERIDVTLHEGSVEIETPIGPSRYAVTAGHRFQASVREGTVSLDDVAEPLAKREVRAEPAPDVAPAPRTEPVATKSEGPARAPAESARMKAPSAEAKPSVDPKDVVEGSPEEPWAKRVQRGAFSDVVAAARARGVADCVANCPAADLRALADAARYTGAADIATDALLALRSRFKGSREGAAAAFLLGHTAESAGDLAGADRWYSTYLAESVGGPLAAEALAGRMLVAERLGAKGRAAELAHEYVKRFPEGAAVRTARRLAGPD
jgi:hypothetical protein